MSTPSEQDELARELRERSRDVGGHPLTLDSVRNGARRIRVRRRIVSGLVAAAVLAVVVPTALAVTADVDGSQPGPVAPSPTVTASAEPFPDAPVLLTTEGLPRGEDPQVPYIVAGEELVTPDGTLDLPGDISAMTPFRDGWLALGSQSRDGLEALWLDADLDVLRSRPTSGSSLAVSPDSSPGGSQVAWTEVGQGRGETLLYGAPTVGGEPQTWSVQSDGEVRPIGFLGDGRVVFTVVETSLNAVAEPDGTITELDGFLHLAGASEAAGLVSGLTGFEDPRTCSAVLDPGAGEMLWETCDYKLGAFSPNGQYVIGTPPDADGLGAPSLAVLDARSGDVLVEFEPERDDQISMYQLAWEGDDSIVAMTMGGRDVLMLRLTLGGDVEQVGATGISENMNLPFWFAETPRL